MMLTLLWITLALTGVDSMAITQNLLDSRTLNNNTVWTSNSISPSANQLILLAINTHDSPQPDVPTVAGNGLTWVHVASALYNGGAFLSRISIFRAMGSSPSTGTVTATYTSGTIDQLRGIISEFDGVDTSGTNGSGAIGDTDTAAVDPDPVICALTFADAGNATFMACGKENGAATIGAVSPMVMITEVGANNECGTSFYNANDTSPEMNNTSTHNMGGVAIEIVAAAAGANPHGPFGHPFHGPFGGPISV